MTEQVYNISLNSSLLVNPILSTNNQSLQTFGTNKTSNEILNTIEPVSSALSSINNQTNINLSNASNQSETKINRIQMLRILAIKTAAILDWNLLLFEKEYNFKTILYNIRFL